MDCICQALRVAQWGAGTIAKVAATVLATGRTYATDEAVCANSPEWPPTPATHWFYQEGGMWAAVLGNAERETWWDGGPVPQDGPEVWEYPIDQRPPSGVLSFRRADGTDVFRPIWPSMTAESEES